MSNPPRVSLIDPLLYQSTYINPNPVKPVTINFWKKFNPLNFMINIGIPLAVFIFILFILKDKYLSKLQKNGNKKNDKQDQLPAFTGGHMYNHNMPLMNSYG